MRDRFDCPVWAYKVSGEYAMVQRRGGRRAISTSAPAALETLTAIKRAGAGTIVTYWARDLAAVALRQRTDRWRRATSLIPGGVNSPVRAMRAVGLDEPVFVARGEGAWIEDVEGNRYVDWVQSWGPLVFGHADPVTLAAVHEAAERGTTLRRGDRGGGRARGGDRRRRPVGRDGAARLLGDRGVDERAAARARRDAAATA